MFCNKKKSSKNPKLRRQETKKGIKTGGSNATPAAAAAAAATDALTEAVAHHQDAQADIVAQAKLMQGFATDLGFHHESNEDTSNIIEDLFAAHPGEGEYQGTQSRKVSMFGVYDGHGGPGCSKYVKETLPSLVANALYQANFDDVIGPALLKSFHEMEAKFAQRCRDTGDTSGSCATCVILKGTRLFCGNAGDSKAIVFQQSKTNASKFVNKIELNERHSAELKSERKRIKAAGGEIFPDGSVYGVLFPTRGFGDFDVKADGKPVVIPTPNGVGISPTPFVELDQTVTSFLLVASDGLWDFVDDEKIMQTVLKQPPRSLNKICEALIQEARMGGSEDDVTVVLTKIEFD
eukprot:m.73329 g.73329  ORF g.73329 m.73329 type:complete len:350 (-) comp17022_c1_seq2:56-1105(-)